ncbi:hypothetical protein LCGC14_1458560 [marine sediment metagenome]|uniref:Uncharacterized protein n=1 Tax=marine sediment metagenome TaxID=412755 RepID=A0A0F9JFQ5_9ZZZZ
MVPVKTQCRKCGYEEIIDRYPNNIYLIADCPVCKKIGSFYKKFEHFIEIQKTIIELQSLEL